MNFKKSFMAIAMSSLLSVGAVSAKGDASIVDQVKDVVTDYVLPAVSLATCVKGGLGFGLSFTDKTMGDSSLVSFIENYFPGFKGTGDDGKEGKVMNIVNIVLGATGTAAGVLNVVDLVKGE